jgi:hypothetical protein
MEGEDAPDKLGRDRGVSKTRLFCAILCGILSVRAEGLVVLPEWLHPAARSLTATSRQREHREVGWTKASKAKNKDRDHLIEQELKWRSNRLMRREQVRGKNRALECVALERFAYRPGTAGGIGWHNSPTHVIGPPQLTQNSSTHVPPPPTPDITLYEIVVACLHLCNQYAHAEHSSRVLSLALAVGRRYPSELPPS